MTRLATLALVPGALAASILNLPRGTREVNVVFQLNKATSEAAIDVWNEDATTVWAQSCSRSLNTGPFENAPLSFEVDDSGTGTLIIGSKNYTISDTDDTPGAVKCGRVVDGHELVVSCHVPISDTIPLRRMRKRDLQDCFPKGPVELTGVVAALESNGTNVDVDWSHAGNDAASQLDESAKADQPQGIQRRQRFDFCTQWKRTRRVGDGSPRQTPLHIQVSLPFDCEEARECSIQHNEVKSYSVSWSAGASVWQWINGGFAVTETVEMGNGYECGGSTGDYFAVFKQVGHTAYKVRNAYYNACYGWRETGEPFTLRSPNANNKGSKFYCAYGRHLVREESGYQFFTDDRAGGP